MLSDICVIGFPSKLGGADTELDHQIYVWQQLGIKVHLLHTGPLDENCYLMGMERRGCVIHEPCNWAACKGMHVISYCNASFIENIEEIRQYALSTTFVNCMTWLFDKEKDAHKRGLIDFFIYQTDHVLQKVRHELEAINTVYRPVIVRPYFCIDEFPFHENRPEGTFRFARISREDPGKFHPAQLWVYETMVAPVLKEGTILGINEPIREKIGREPNWIRGYPAGGTPTKDVYQNAHCIIQMTETYENLPRIGFEAMASGCLLIVDNRGGWRELVQHGQTGFLCNDQREFVYYSSRAAFEREERKLMVRQARDWLEANWSMETSKDQWQVYFEQLEVYSR